MAILYLNIFVTLFCQYSTERILRGRRMGRRSIEPSNYHLPILAKIWAAIVLGQSLAPTNTPELIVLTANFAFFSFFPVIAILPTGSECRISLLIIRTSFWGFKNETYDIRLATVELIGKKLRF
jgi:hypothetical protein